MSSASAVNGVTSNTGMNHSRRMILFYHRDVRGGIALDQVGTDRFDAFANLFHRAVEVARSGFDHDIFYAERRRQPLCLEPLFGVVSGKELFGKSAITQADFDGGIAFVP